MADTTPRLTPSQRAALALLQRAESEGDDPSDNAVHSGSECFWDSGAWIGFRTAYALKRRGLADVWFDCCDDYGHISLTAPPVTPSRTDRQPPASSSETKGGLPPVGPDETKPPDLVTRPEGAS